MNSVLLVANQVLFCKVPKRYEEDCLKLLSCYLTSPVMIQSFGYGSTLAQNSKASQSKAPPNQKKKKEQPQRGTLYLLTLLNHNTAPFK